MKKNPVKIRKTGGSALPESIKMSVCSIINLAVSAAGLLTGLYFWIYDRTYAEFSDLYYFLRIIVLFILLLYVSVIYNLITLCEKKHKANIISVLSFIFACVALFLLSVDIIFLFL